MTDRWGIDERYIDAVGVERRVDASVVETLRGVIGEAPAKAPVLVRRPGGALPGGAAVVELEDGGELAVQGRLPEDTPLGYHRLRHGCGTEVRLIVSPGRCHLPADLRAWGWAVQLYATRSRSSWGMGDLADLRRLTQWSAQSGAGFVLVNPLQAVAPTGPQQPSPYFPASRRFRNPIYLRVEEAPGAREAAAELEHCAALGRALNSERHIDRDAVWEHKRRALESIWASAPQPEFDAWFTTAAPALHQFATWAALTEHVGQDWRRWPGAYRHPGSPEVATFAAEHDDRVRFHTWLQWLTERQLADAGGDLMLIQDLPIGVDAGGADAWAWQDLLAQDVTVGAPPDEFNTAGQDWGLPPFVPWRLAQAGYEPFVEIVRAGLAARGGLRIDHVMGLFRLWWIPRDEENCGDPTGGAFVRYPAADLLDILALESHRAGAVVVGEDLGTVEEAARTAMTEHGMLSYRLLWFESDDPACWPRTAMAAVTTHDLPTVAGLWDGSDLTAAQDAGLKPNVEATEAIRNRLADDADLADEAENEAAVLGAHRLLARAPSMLLSATLDDALAEPARPNIPGADGARPNWCLALPKPLEDLEADPTARALAEVLREAVGAPCALGGQIR